MALLKYLAKLMKISVPYKKRQVLSVVQKNLWCETYKRKTQVLDYQIPAFYLGDSVGFASCWCRCRGGKIIPYNPETGHRIKDDHFPPVMRVHTNLKAAHLLPPEWRLTQCLFGEHLLQDKVNANVALVESEKTAVICSLLLPEYIWLATGGKSQFNDRLMVLKGRKVTAFPDIDGYDEWRKKAKSYPMLDITISDILERNATPEQRERQVDIADLLLEEMLKRK